MKEKVIKVVSSKLLTVLALFLLLIFFSYHIYAENNNNNNTSEIIEKQDINKVYYAKVDSKQDYFKNLKEKGIKVELSKIKYSKIIIEKNITAEQNLTIYFNNTKYNKSILKIDLYMHVKKELLKNVKEIKIYDEKNNLISETPFLIINTTNIKRNFNDSNNNIKFKIKYLIKPIEEKTFCEKKTIKDIIPKDAYNINSNLDLNEIIKEKCKIILKHDLIKDFLEQKIYFENNENEEIENISGKITAEYNNKKINITIKKEKTRIIIKE